MTGIYRDNLEPDLAPWAGRRYTVRQLYEHVALLLRGRPQKYLSLVVIRGGRVGWLPLAAKPMKLTVSRMTAIVSGLSNASAAGLALPDALYLMNVWDEGRCPAAHIHAAAAVADTQTSTAAAGSTLTAASSAAAAGRRRRLAAQRRPGGPPCTVPLFSLIKRWDWATNTSIDADVLLPFFNHVYGELVGYPWERKHGKALMRAALQREMGRNATRLWLLRLQREDPEGRRLLDAGITNNLKPGFKVQLAETVSIPDHARWRYLLSADGFTASCRFGKLLGLDSVVLKEVTPWIEYYYRSAQPGVHFVPFDKDNVLQVLRSLEGDRPRCEAVIAAAQRFAYTYLSQPSKALYVRRALGAYAALFDDMAAFLGRHVQPGEVEAEGGLTLQGLLERMRGHAEGQAGPGGGGG